VHDRVERKRSAVRRACWVSRRLAAKPEVRMKHERIGDEMAVKFISLTQRDLLGSAQAVARRTKDGG
jgi:hypothetical protein